MNEILYPAEFVFPGHPDKLCDAIADALVAEAIALEPRALVGIEVAVHRNRVFVTGRIAAQGAELIDVPAIVRETYRSAGYSKSWRPAPEDLEVVTDLCVGPLEEGEAEFRSVSDDQAICVGYAVDRPQTNYLPVEQWLVGQLTRRLYRLRDERPDLGLGPDGKVLVVVGESPESWVLRAFTCSLQQRVNCDDVALHRAVRVTLAEELNRLAAMLPGLRSHLPDELTVNGAGAFEVGGPHGDNGLSGKKLVIDAYGPRVPIGGGAWSGKDFHKADRAGGLYARRLAKLLVITRGAQQATVTVAYSPGAREPAILTVTGTDRAGAQRCQTLLEADLLTNGARWRLPISLVEIARWGHLQDGGAPWERFGRI